ncbi:hypothetical protein H4R34_000672 [Dimargaris verticillata]|uniref:Uncharacterized protein n=1 Tax=Dimargaris verticillata TaxID=2761393 RepID=A0A9W8B6Q8_9FUNG|nr:hypothetical protein H4R34_000672 [Dimargaris verticillata]
MARISIWLLATMAGVSLVNATPMQEGKDQVTVDSLKPGSRRSALPSIEPTDVVMSQLPQEPAVSQDDLDGVFNSLRQNLGLPDMKDVTGSPTKVGLRTLLDGAQVEYRAMFALVLRHFESQDNDITAASKSLDTYYPDIYQNGLSQERKPPQFEYPPMFNIRYPFVIDTKDISPSLADLGRMSQPEYIVGVIKALFAMLKNKDDLLKEFEAMVQSEQDELQDSQDVISTDQTEEAAALALTKKHRAFMNRFWLEVIGGGEKERLSYYLSNMLAFDVITRILGQVLESGKQNNGNYDKALEIARQISQFSGFTERFGPKSVNAPNHFEFIMLYATAQKLENRDKLLRDAQELGNVDVSFLYNCFKHLSNFSPVDGWKDIFGINVPSDIGSSSKKNEAQCIRLEKKYNRSLKSFINDRVKLYYIDGEDISDLYEADDGDDDYFSDMGADNE